MGAAVVLCGSVWLDQLGAAHSFGFGLAGSSSCCASVSLIHEVTLMILSFTIPLVKLKSELLYKCGVLLIG